jgi:peptidoglycan/xylan/chitin deacetylase (PgdA/CDA1 family)
VIAHPDEQPPTGEDPPADEPAAEAADTPSLDASDSAQPLDTPDSAQPLDTTDSAPPLDTTNSAPPLDITDSTQPSDTTDSALPTDTSDSAQPEATADEAGPTPLEADGSDGAESRHSDDREPVSTMSVRPSVPFGLTAIGPAVNLVKRSPRAVSAAALLVALAVATVFASTTPRAVPITTLRNITTPDLPTATSTASPSDSLTATASAQVSPTPTPVKTTKRAPAPARPGTEKVGGYTATLPIPTHTTPPPTTSAPTAQPSGSDNGSTPTPTATATPTPTPTQTGNPPGYAPAGWLTLQQYLALVPSFPAAPGPVSVTLTHEPGKAALIDSIPTSQPVAFVTIDDGYDRWGLTHDLIRQTGIPMMNFLISTEAEQDPSYFSSLLHGGMVIDNHTATHPHLIDLTYEEQRAEICDASDEIEQLYGHRPTNFRPPYLEYNDDTLRAAWDCGITAVISADVGIDGTQIGYAYPDLKIHPGDILVIHYDDVFADSFITALTAIKAAGLTPVLLSRYFTVAP